MRIHKHTQNRDDRRTISRMLHIWLYPSEDRDSIADLDLQAVVARKLRREFSARFHLGKKWSETPLDAHLTIAGTGLYGSVNFPGLRHIAHALTKGEGRDLSLSMHSGHLWWKLWTGEDHCSDTAHSHWSGDRKAGTAKYRPWLCRAGNAALDPLTYIVGDKINARETLDTSTATVVMPEGAYPVTLKLERWTWGYKNSKRRRYSHLSVDWSARPGIPWTYDHSCGWKGTEVYGSSVRVPDAVEGKDWVTVAAALIQAEATKSRVLTGWTPEHQASVGA